MMARELLLTYPIREWVVDLETIEGFPVLLVKSRIDEAQHGSPPHFAKVVVDPLHYEQDLIFDYPGEGHSLRVCQKVNHYGRLVRTPEELVALRRSYSMKPLPDYFEMGQVFEDLTILDGFKEQKLSHLPYFRRRILEEWQNMAVHCDFVLTP